MGWYKTQDGQVVYTSPSPTPSPTPTPPTHSGGSSKTPPISIAPPVYSNPGVVKSIDPKTGGIVYTDTSTGKKYGYDPTQSSTTGSSTSGVFVERTNSGIFDIKSGQTLYGGQGIINFGGGAQYGGSSALITTNPFAGGGSNFGIISSLAQSKQMTSPSTYSSVTTPMGPSTQQLATANKTLDLNKFTLPTFEPTIARVDIGFTPEFMKRPGATVGKYASELITSKAAEIGRQINQSPFAGGFGIKPGTVVAFAGGVVGNIVQAYGTASEFGIKLASQSPKQTGIEFGKTVANIPIDVANIGIGLYGAATQTPQTYLQPIFDTSQSRISSREFIEGPLAATQLVGISRTLPVSSTSTFAAGLTTSVTRANVALGGITGISEMNAPLAKGVTQADIYAARQKTPEPLFISLPGYLSPAVGAGVRSVATTFFGYKDPFAESLKTQGYTPEQISSIQKREPYMYAQEAGAFIAGSSGIEFKGRTAFAAEFSKQNAANIFTQETMRKTVGGIASPILTKLGAAEAISQTRTYEQIYGGEVSPGGYLLNAGLGAWSAKTIGKPIAEQTFMSRGGKIKVEVIKGVSNVLDYSEPFGDWTTDIQSKLFRNVPNPTVTKYSGKTPTFSFGGRTPVDVQVTPFTTTIGFAQPTPTQAFGSTLVTSPSTSANIFSPTTTNIFTQIPTNVFTTTPTNTFIQTPTNTNIQIPITPIIPITTQTQTQTQTQTNINIAVNTPQIPPFFFPGPGFELGERRPKYSGVGGFSARYLPNLRGLVSGKIEKGRKSLYTGTEVRGLTKDMAKALGYKTTTRRR